MVSSFSTLTGEKSQCDDDSGVDLPLPLADAGMTVGDGMGGDGGSAGANVEEEGRTGEVPNDLARRIHAGVPLVFRVTTGATDDSPPVDPDPDASTLLLPWNETLLPRMTSPPCAARGRSNVNTGPARVGSDAAASQSNPPISASPGLGGRLNRPRLACAAIPEASRTDDAGPDVGGRSLGWLEDGGTDDCSGGEAVVRWRGGGAASDGRGVDMRMMVGRAPS